MAAEALGAPLSGAATSASGPAPQGIARIGGVVALSLARRAMRPLDSSACAGSCP